VPTGRFENGFLHPAGLPLVESGKDFRDAFPRHEERRGKRVGALLDQLRRVVGGSHGHRAIAIEERMRVLMRIGKAPPCPHMRGIDQHHQPDRGVVHEQPRHLLREIRARRPDSLLGNQADDVGNGSRAKTEPPALFFGNALTLLDRNPRRRRQRLGVSRRSLPRGMAKQALQAHALPAQGHAAIDLPLRLRRVLQAGDGTMQRDEDIVLAPVRGKEPGGIAPIPRREARQLQRGNRALAGLQLGDCRPVNADGVRGILLVDAGFLSCLTQTSGKLIYVNAHGLLPGGDDTNR